MALKAPYGDVGMPAFEEGIAFGGTEELFSGPTPQVFTEDFPVKAGVALPAFSVVGLDADNTLTLAADSGTVVQAIGVTTAPVAASASAQRVAIFRAGNFNPAALNYGPTFTTLEEKLGAFRGAPTPTNIVVRPRL